MAYSSDATLRRGSGRAAPPRQDGTRHSGLLTFSSRPTGVLNGGRHNFCFGSGEGVPVGRHHGFGPPGRTRSRVSTRLDDVGVEVRCDNTPARERQRLA
jgi:hypothetical protein